MSRISQVLKNRNRIEKARRKRRKEEIENLNDRAAFRARLAIELRKIDFMFTDESVDAVIIEVEESSLVKFGESIYSNEMLEYDVRQVEGKPNEFEIRRKFIAF